MAHHELTDWLNRIGIILGFLSFWFAAPEFLGEERLKDGEWRLSKLLAEHGSNVVMVLGSTGAAIAAVATLFFCKPGEIWTNLAKFLGAAFLAAAILVFLVTAVLRKLISALANSDRARMNSLIVAAVLLTVSTIIQLALTF